MKKRVAAFVLVFSAIFILCLALPQNKLLTVAESSGFKATSRYKDVTDFIRELQHLSSRIRVETLCTTSEGRAVPLLVIGDPVPASPADLKFDERAIVYFQANIHAGEVEGKEAALMLARDILQEKTPDYLDRLVILIAPIFNPDGNEKISPANRRNQKGPEEGVGARQNGMNLDLNRDGLKLESPEVRGLVENVLNRWDPVFFLDSHTHNGSYHEEPVTWTWGLNPNGDLSLLDFTENKMWPEIDRLMREKYGTPVVPHGDFMDSQDPQKGWVPLGPQPRYLSNYVGLRNRLAVLNENYPYADYETRVRGCYSLFLSFLDFFHASRDEVVSLLKNADQQTVRRGITPSEKDAFIVEYGREPIERRFTIQGYVMEAVETQGQRRRARPTDVKKIYPDVPYYAKYTAERTVRFPHAYLITAKEPDVIEKLRQHGITVERLTEPARLSVESFTLSEMTGGPRLNEGHYTNTVKGSYGLKEMLFPEGTHVVSTAQPLANIAAYLLEPESGDGLLYWNFFDRALAVQWGRGSREYPVYKLYDAIPLVKVVID